MNRQRVGVGGVDGCIRERYPVRSGWAGWGVGGYSSWALLDFYGAFVALLKGPQTRHKSGGVASKTGRTDVQLFTFKGSV